MVPKTRLATLHRGLAHLFPNCRGTDLDHNAPEVALGPASQLGLNRRQSNQRQVFTPPLSVVVSMHEHPTTCVLLSFPLLAQIASEQVVKAPNLCVGMCAPNSTVVFHPLDIRPKQLRQLVNCGGKVGHCAHRRVLVELVVVQCFLRLMTS